MILERNQLVRLCVLMLLHGGIIVAMLFCAMMMHHENRLLDSIIGKTISQGMSEQQKALALLNATHEILKPRHELFSGESQHSIREQFFGSTDVHLMSAKGACGSYAGVLTQLLKRTGIDARLAQMKCGDDWGCHINLEAKVNGKYVALDPLYNIAFEKKDGELASFKEVGSDWEYFKTQTPKNYYQAYQYEDVRYTNWQKIPVLMPLIKKVLDVVMGTKANEISIRSHVLNVYQVYLILLVFFYVLLSLLTYTVLTKASSRNKIVG